ncbi:MAG: glycosyltransferase family 4 protein [Proteobacteria bacterium]|nr:glycosyltransferase family 4 protein [Pseudomonadota bacterium]
MAESHLGGRGTLRTGACISGYVLSEIGLGQAARNLGLAFEAAGIETTYVNLPSEGRQNALEFSGRTSPVNDQRTTIHVLPVAGLQRRAIEPVPGRKNILYPFWELEEIPRPWLRNIGRFDAIWAPSKFIADAFRRATSLPVIHVPLPMPFLDPAGKPDGVNGRFVVLTYLDVDSHVQRKNPTGAVNAFLSAFSPVPQGIELWVKLRGTRDDGIRRSFQALMQKIPQVKIIDETVSRTAMDQLLQQCDVLLSLHRSEGFGLGAAEALILEKAVVATDYSGTRDFINNETGYPVTYDITSITTGEYVAGTEGMKWADPSLDDAAAKLRLAYSDQSLRRARGQAGRQLMERQHAPAVVGRQIAALLRELWS